MMESMTTTASSDNGDIHKQMCNSTSNSRDLLFHRCLVQTVGILKERQVKTVGTPSHPVLQSLIFQTFFLSPMGPIVQTNMTNKFIDPQFKATKILIRE